MLKRYLSAALLSGLTLMAVFGCGGGGGGAPPAHVRGRVMFLGTGLPLADATVTIGGASVKTLSTGIFDFPNISSTSTTLGITASGVTTLSQPLPVLVALPAVNELGDVFVVATGTGYTATASGTVVRADTLAVIPGAKVNLSGQIFVTGADGKFNFTGLPVGLGGPNLQVGLITVALFEDKPILIDPPLGASPPDNALGIIEVSPPVGGIPGGPTDIHGKISLQGMTDLSGTIVELHKKSDGSLLGSGTTAPDGLFGFWVIAGQYTVKAIHTGFQTQQQDVTLNSPAVPVTVNMTLVP